MAGNIQLTPAELISQAGQMRALYEQYTSFFNNVDSVLKSINDSWSPNLANNFLSKITSMKNGCKNILFLIDNGINIAETSAKSFGSVDEALAKLMGEFMESHGGSILGTAGPVIPDIVGNDEFADIVSKVTGVPINEYAEIAKAISDGDLKSAVDKLVPGFTDEMKDKVMDFIKDKTGLNVDPDKVIESFQNGDITGGLLDIAEASNNLALSTGGVSEMGVAIDFLINSARTATDPNGFAVNDSNVYSNRILDSASEGKWLDIVDHCRDYVGDVGIRAVCNAAGDTVTNVVDTVMKNYVGFSLSEINDKIGDLTGFNPGKELKNVLSNIGDNWHSFVSGENTSAVSVVVPDAAHAVTDLIGNIGDDIKKMF